MMYNLKIGISTGEGEGSRLRLGYTAPIAVVQPRERKAEAAFEGAPGTGQRGSIDKEPDTRDAEGGRDGGRERVGCKAKKGASRRLTPLTVRKRARSSNTV